MFYIFYIKNYIKYHFVHCSKRNNFRFIHKFLINLIKFIVSANMRKNPR